MGLGTARPNGPWDRAHVLHVYRLVDGKAFGWYFELLATLSVSCSSVRTVPSFVNDRKEHEIIASLDRCPTQVLLDRLKADMFSVIYK